MSQFHIYRSTDAGAPVLTGQTGSLNTVLTAVLVNGYGGTGSLGWTLSYSASVSGTLVNQTAYKMSTKPFYLRVCDDYPTHGSTTSDAFIKFDETLTSISSSLFVQDAFVRKSSTTDSASRAWTVIGDSKTFYMFVLSNDVANQYYGWSFGEFDSYMTESFNVTIIGRSTAGSTNGSEGLDQLNVVPSTVVGSFIARPYTRVFMTASATSVVAVGRHGDGSKGRSTFMFGQTNFTNQTDNGLYLSPVWIHETSGNIRGKLRGLWQFCHPVASVNDGDTFSGSAGGNLSGKTFMVIKNTPNSAIYTIETSNTLS